MTDIADILGVEKDEPDVDTSKKTKKSPKKDKYANLPRYLREIVDDNNPPPEMLLQEKKTLVISKEPAQKWVYAEFTSSARSDCAKFRHWVRRNVEYPDYPFARFNIKISVITYTSEEYDDCLFDVPNNWTKGHSDELFDLCRRYDLRWPVIMDSFSAKQFSLEDCQMVFLDVTKTVLERRQRLGVNLTPDETAYISFKYDYENSIKRRKQQDILFRSPGLSQQEEKQLQQRLKTAVDTLSLIGSPDTRRSYGPRLTVDAAKNLIEEEKRPDRTVFSLPLGSSLASRFTINETEMPRDMKEEFKRILNELNVTNLKCNSLKSRISLSSLKRRLALLLVMKKCKADNGLAVIPTSQIKRWTTIEAKPDSKRKKTK